MLETSIVYVLLLVHQRLQDRYKETSHVDFSRLRVLTHKVVSRDEVMLARVRFVAVAAFFTDLMKLSDTGLK